MPLYEYQCKKCSGSFELLITAGAKPRCLHCGSRSLRQLISAPAAPGKSTAIVARGRARAAKEGHLSNYSRSNGRIVD